MLNEKVVQAKYTELRSTILSTDNPSEKQQKYVVGLVLDLLADAHVKLTLIAERMK